MATIRKNFMKNMKIFKTEIFLKLFLVRISHRPIRNTMHKKEPKICTHYGVSAAKIYLYNSSKSRPPLGMSSEYNSVQSYSGSCLGYLICFK